MVGPVLLLELLLGGRRGRQYVFRWIYSGWLVLQLFVLYMAYWFTNSQNTFGRLEKTSTGDFARSYIDLFVVQQLLLLLIATPSFAAGAITDEKTRGTLQYLLAADLTPGEIITGKLLARMAQVIILALSGFPLFCFIGVFGGLDPLGLLAVVGTTLIPVFALASASILASVWSKQTRDAVLGLYGVGGICYLTYWIVHWLHQSAFGISGLAIITTLIGQADSLLRYFNPVFILEPSFNNGKSTEVAKRLLGSFLSWGIIGIVCLGLAVWRLRPAYFLQLEGEGKKNKTTWRPALRSEVSSEPIRWKERQVDGVAILASLRAVPAWVGILMVFFLSTLSSFSILWASLPPQWSLGRILAMATSLNFAEVAQFWEDLHVVADYFWVQAVVVMLLASLIVGIRCSGAISGERERQTWEALLLTPLDTEELIRGKLSGIIGASSSYLLAYSGPALLLSLVGGLQALFWTGFGLAVTWLAMYFVGAAGLWCSVRSKSSWRSLLGTLGWGYVGGFLMWVVTTPLIVILAVIILVGLSLVDTFLQTSLSKGAGTLLKNFWPAYRAASFLVLAGVFFGAAKYFIYDAEKRVSDRERTRHWKHHPGRQRRKPQQSLKYYR